ncbi:MAG: starch-binding protein [Sodaliphilus sp.]
MTTVTQIEAPTGTISPIIRANPADGTVFSSSLSVALTVTPATDIYYTLDGSRASAASTKYTGPITLTETTTINAYAAYEDADTCISFTYTKEIPVGSDHAVYFYNDDNWKNCYAYCYDDNHKIANAFSGAWPGKKLTQTVEYDGMTLYKFGFTSDGVLSNPMIIFNNNNGIQTSDKVYQENAIYNCGGLVIGTYTETPTGINKISASGNFKVFAQDGRLVIVSERNCTVEAVKLDGTCRTLRVMNGYNYFELPKGFYIVAGKKVVI